MREKIRTALRIAAYYGYANLCISSFGLGPRFRNPPEEVAIMWQEAFLRDSEFVGLFGDIVFAFDSPEGRNAGASPRGSTAKNIGRGGKKQSTAANDLEVFKHIFKPAVIYDAFKS